MPDDIAAQFEKYREYLGVLGRMQLDDQLAAKVDLSGVVQLTLFEASRSGWEERTEEERLPWIRRIFAHNLLDEIRKFRSQARDVTRERSIEHAMEQSASRLNQWLASEQSTPSRKAMLAEEELRLALALACLPDAQREAIEMHYLKGLSLEQISQRMNKTKGAVAALVFRGTSKLRELLTNQQENPDV